MEKIIEVILRIVFLVIGLFLIGALVVISLKNALNNLVLVPIGLILAIIVSLFIETKTLTTKALVIFSIFLLVMLFFGLLSMPTSTGEPCFIGRYC